MKTKCTIDLSQRPHTLTVERLMNADAARIYEAWTNKFDCWFGQPGETMMVGEVDRPFFFYNRHDWGRHAHYGRFTELERDKIVELTWLTGKPGTYGAETLLRIELTPKDSGTLLRLTHSGFESAEDRDGHKQNWPEALEILEKVLNS